MMKLFLTLVLLLGLVISSPAQTVAVAIDGSSLTGGTVGSLVTNDGTWTFGTVQQASGDYFVLLNGANFNTVAAVVMHVTNSGTLYMGTAHGLWWRYDGSSVLVSVSDPRPPAFGTVCSNGTIYTSGSRTYLCDGHWSGSVGVVRTPW